MRQLGIVCLALVLTSALGEYAAAQELALSPDQWRVLQSGYQPDRGTGWYFSIWKLVFSLLLFLAWIVTTDWINEDVQRLKLGWKKWNAIIVFTFLACFLLQWVTPSFYLGFPLALLGYLGPALAYVKVRNGATSKDDKILTKAFFKELAAGKLKKLGVKVEVERKAADLPMELIAQGGANAGEEKATSFKLTKLAGYDPLRFLLTDALAKRAQTLMLDYTPQNVSIKWQIDGVFHDQGTRDRASGDAILEVLKTAAFLDPKERVKRQSGMFETKVLKTRYPTKVTSQGTPTGERVIVQLDDGAPHRGRLEEIGMRPKTMEDLKALLQQKAGFILVAAAPGRGLTTLLAATATGVDRFMRTISGVESTKTDEMRVENVTITRFDPDKGETAATVLPSAIRKYPDGHVIPDLADPAAVEILCGEVTKNERLVIASIGAKDAPEALLRVLMLKVPAKTFAPVVTAVVCSRLIRKLCPDCKQAYTPQPQLLQQLGLPADKVQQLYRQYQPPPIVEGTKNKPQPPCAKCSGLGYFGRTGIYEFLVVNNDVRAALLKQPPSLDEVRKAAQKAGMLSMQREAILLAAQGVTSVEEIMRSFKEKE